MQLNSNQLCVLCDFAVIKCPLYLCGEKNVYIKTYQIAIHQPIEARIVFQ